MELIWTDLMAERVVYCGVAQALVEGDIPQIEGRPAKEILSATGDVALSGAETAAGAVRLSGEVRLHLICAGDGGVFAFTSRAAFRHTVQVEGAQAGMPIKAGPILQAMEVKLEGGRIMLSAEVDIAIRVTDNRPIKALSGLEGIQDLEMQGRSITLAKRQEVFRDVLSLREEMDAADAHSVLQYDIVPSLREIQSEGRGVEISGSLTVSALVQGEEGRLFQLTQNIPFTETLDVIVGSDLSVELTIETSQVRVAEEFGLLVVEARLLVCLYGIEHMEVTLPQDLFSPSMAFDCARETLRLCADMGPLSHRHTLHETVSIPAGLPEASRVLYAAVRPVITTCNITEERLCIEGLLVTRVIYESESGTLFAFTEDIPFECCCPAQGATDAIPSAMATATAAGSGRSLEMSFSIQIWASMAFQRTETVVTGIQESQRQAPPQGIIVYFAGAGETLYDVAKRFLVPRQALIEAWDGQTETLEEGQKLVFLR
ncbi:MAG: DUF3794 domain-containing protein [Clostridia bacterium]|nr:DUF3794 domain-containing protein [Candidatus Pelethousia sp.]NCB30231.1 DUF3794 domain-containing protein [Clostridia bacterium]